VATVTQKAEMQANARVGVNSIAQDLSQAGAGGIPWGGITSMPANYKFAHDTNGVDYLTCNTINLAPSVLYAVFPADGCGPVILTNNTDGIAMLYADPAYNWGGYTTTNITSLGAGGYQMVMPALPLLSPTPPFNPLPASQQPSPAVNDPVNGPKAGDLLMLSNANGYAIGVVTVNPAGNTITMAGGDFLSMNGGIANIANAGLGTFPPTTATRVFLITYFIEPLDANGNPLGPTAVPPTAVDYRLMRQVNAQPPVPVAEHVVNLKFAYDMNDPSSGVGTSNVQDATITNPAPPPATIPAYNQIRNVYVTVTSRSTPTNKGTYLYATMYTNVSPRNLSFHDTYK